MKIIDISWPINQNTTEYKDRKTVKISTSKEFENDGSRESILTLNIHTGTHIDAPAHFLKDGKTIDQIDLNKLVGNCRVLDLSNVEEKITKEDLEKYNIQKDEIILLETKNSNLSPNEKFDYNFVYLEKSGAQHLATKEIKCVGIDYLGIERNQPNHETHKILLEKDIPIIEGLRLNAVSAGNFYFYCLPLFIKNTEAALARAILIEKTEGNHDEK